MSLLALSSGCGLRRSISTITAPCFTAVSMCAGSGGAGRWRLEQYHDGRQKTLAEVGALIAL